MNAAVPFENKPLTAEQESEVAKAARIFVNTLIKVTRDTMPAGSAPERMQLIVTMGTQSVVTGAALSFDSEATAGLDADLYESIILGLASAVGMKLGVVDPLTREHALRTFWRGVHGGIEHAAQINQPKGEA